MDDYRFEIMQDDFLTDVLAIYNHYVVHSTATFHAHLLTIEEMRELVYFKSPQYQTFVICHDRVIAGYVLLTQHKKREAYDGTAEVTIYLRPEYTGKGLGTLALQFIETVAKQAEFHVLVATICGENEESLRLFDRNGYFKCAHYREVGRKFERWLDLVAYQKII